MPSPVYPHRAHLGRARAGDKRPHARGLAPALVPRARYQTGAHASEATYMPGEENRWFDRKATRFDAHPPACPVLALTLSGYARWLGKYGDDRRNAVILHPDDYDLFERYRRIFAAREPYEMRVSDTAIAVHELGEHGADEPDLDLESLDRALD